MQDSDQKKCSSPGCRNLPSEYCECNSEAYYMCDDHKDAHRQTGGTHRFKLAYVRASNSKINGFIEKFSQEDDCCAKEKQALISQTHQLISFIYGVKSKCFKAIEVKSQRARSTIFALQSSDNVLFHKDYDYLEEFTPKVSLVLPDTSALLPAIEDFLTSILKAVPPPEFPPVDINPLISSNYAKLDFKLNILSSHGLNLKEEKTIIDMAFCQQNNLLVCSEKNGVIRIYNLLENIEKARILAHSDSEISCLKITQNGKFALTSSANGSLKLWNMNALNFEKELLNQPGRISNLLELKNGLMVSAGWDGIIRAWENKKWEKTHEIQNVHTVKWFGSITCICASSDEKYIITGGHDGYIKLYDIMKKQIVGENYSHKNTVTCLAVTKNNLFLVSGSQDKTVKLMNLLNMRIEATFKCHNKSVCCVMASLDDKNLASVGEDNKIIIYNIEAMRKQAKIKSGLELSRWISVFPEFPCFQSLLKS